MSLKSLSHICSFERFIFNKFSYHDPATFLCMIRCHQLAGKKINLSLLRLNLPKQMASWFTLWIHTLCGICFIHSASKVSHWNWSFKSWIRVFLIGKSSYFSIKIILIFKTVQIGLVKRSWLQIIIKLCFMLFKSIHCLLPFNCIRNRFYFLSLIHSLFFITSISSIGMINSRLLTLWL